MRHLLQLWRVDVPAVRDVQAFGRDLFQIPWAPDDGRAGRQQRVADLRGRGQSEPRRLNCPRCSNACWPGTTWPAKSREQFRQARLPMNRRWHAVNRQRSTGETGVGRVAAETLPRLLRLQVRLDQQEPAGRRRYPGGHGWNERHAIPRSRRLAHHRRTRRRRSSRDAPATLDLPETAGVSQLQSALDGRQQRVLRGLVAPRHSGPRV